LKGGQIIECSFNFLPVKTKKLALFNYVRFRAKVRVEVSIRVSFRFRAKVRVEVSIRVSFRFRAKVRVELSIRVSSRVRA